MDSRDSTGGLATKPSTTTVDARIPRGTIMGDPVPGREWDEAATIPAFCAAVTDELGQLWGDMSGVRFAWHNAPEGSPIDVLINGSPPGTEEERNLSSCVLLAVGNVLAADSFRAYKT